MLSRVLGFIDSIKARDPAPRSRWEILLYPGVHAVALHRAAHWLFGRRLFLLARATNHFSRFLTAIDIHPGAVIGRNLFIEHGFVVIGETAVVGDNVTIYQGATLGGTNPTNGQGGKRHPTIGDNVIISLGSAVLGPIHVGADSRIGANAVVLKDVPEGATMIGIPAKPIDRSVEASAAKFTPYGTPVDYSDPVARELDSLQSELAALQLRISHLQDKDNRAATSSPSRRSA